MATGSPRRRTRPRPRRRARPAPTRGGTPSGPRRSPGSSCGHELRSARGEARESRRRRRNARVQTRSPIASCRRPRGPRHRRPTCGRLRRRPPPRRSISAATASSRSASARRSTQRQPRSAGARRGGADPARPSGDDCDAHAGTAPSKLGAVPGLPGKARTRPRRREPALDRLGDRAAPRRRAAQASRSPTRASASRRASASWRTADSPLITECDVRSDESIDALFAEAAETFGGELDLLVHSVAFADARDLEGRFTDTPRDRFWLALDVSAYSLVGCSGRPSRSWSRPAAAPSSR